MVGAVHRTSSFYTMFEAILANEILPHQKREHLKIKISFTRILCVVGWKKIITRRPFTLKSKL